jgi:hypothetical protein
MSPVRWTSLAGPTVVVGAMVGLWWSALGAERAVTDASDAALARHAAAYLTVLTPAGTGQGFDAARLLSSANTLAEASFWTGGLQVALGSVPLVPDTIALLPVADSLLLRLEHGATAVVATPAGQRVALVPFLARDHSTLLGWVAAWRTVQTHIPSRHLTLLTALAVFGLGSATVTLLRYTRPPWRFVAYFSALGVVGLLALDLGWSVRRTARAATDTRLLTLRRLVEAAATAEGVRQARLPEIGAGLESRRLAAPFKPPDDVVRDASDEDVGTPVARIVAATPRTQGGIEFRATPAEAQLGGMWLRLASWLAVVALGLALTGSAEWRHPIAEAGG